MNDDKNESATQYGFTLSCRIELQKVKYSGLKQNQLGFVRA